MGSKVTRNNCAKEEEPGDEARATLQQLFLSLYQAVYSDHGQAVCSYKPCFSAVPTEAVMPIHDEALHRGEPCN